jgi:hypothetical protein
VIGDVQNEKKLFVEPELTKCEKPLHEITTDFGCYLCPPPIGGG